MTPSLKPGKVRSMTIEPGQGGFTSQVRRAPPKGKNSYDMEPELPTIHPNVAHLQAHIGTIFGGGKARAASSGAPMPPGRAAKPANAGPKPSALHASIAQKMLGG